ncbi:DeoR/GlpR family DNA-binding transcription regulator [Propionispira raffinosivorans]|uniref:DeoR/GlpR family DNA-binding transcription regulator n=1 Tax=Propionispira raffinosivorans TaxID=86959 RepID=UPI000368B9DF|nr:DeoR/GlpR family DNA-binding transcription regulator [Propionispira raffinosivorans]
MHTRHTQLLDFVNNENRISVALLAQKLQVSEVTIRKDLDILEKRGLLRREHGFAVMIASDDIGHHLSFNYDNKRRIAQKAAASVKNGETVMIESGSCCALLAEELATKRRGITIITNSAFIAAFIRKSPAARIVLLGGDYQNESQVMVGPMLKKCVQDFFVDKVFIGTDGFTEKHGFTGNNLLRTEAIRAMAERANKIIILTESIKFSQQGVVTQFKSEEIAAIFTDDHIPEEKKQFLQKLNTIIYTVPFE